MKSYTVYFDLETYKDGLNEKVPTGGVYGVVCSWHEGRSYNYRKPLDTKVFIGVRALFDFLDFLEKEFNNEKCRIRLFAYNMPYDFCFMRHDLIRYWDLKKMHVNMSDDRKIILSGSFTYKNMEFELNDLNLFQRTFALASWIKELNDKYSTDGKPLSVEYRIDGVVYEKPIAAKLKIDYDKWDLYENPDEKYDGRFSHINKMYYKNSNGEERLLDIEQEWDYILIDGLAMPLVYREIYKTKCTFLDILRKEYPDISEAEFTQMQEKYGFWYRQSVSSVSKCIAEMFIDCKFSDVYRMDINDGVPNYESTIEYGRQTNSLLGGLTTGNLDFVKYIAKLREFIESYDVNSMYPSIMNLGMPCGHMFDHLPDGIELNYRNGELTGDYVCWVYIQGTTDGEEAYVEWKKQFEWNDVTINCPNFDNDILGKWFLNSPTKIQRGFYVTRNYWELINKTCNHNLRMECCRYQYLNKSISKYIQRMNEIKMNSKKGTAENITAKLAMNSLYGKTLEGTHMFGVVYGKDLKSYKSKTAKVMLDVKGYNYEREGIDGILPIEKEEAELPSRMAGVYVTNTARLILLTGIFDEIANGNDFLYADTDSIKLIVRNPVKLPIDDKKLGYWKKEGSKGKTYDRFNQWRYPSKVKRYAIWNDAWPIEEGTFAYSGIAAPILKQFKTRERIEALFSDECNVLFVNGKTATIRNKVTDQPIIYNTDFMTNNKIRPTHISAYDIDTGLWSFEKFSEELLLKYGKILLEQHGKYETKKIVRR